MEDKAIIEKCLRGQSEYFEEIVNRYKRLIFSIILNYIKDKEQVEDIAQDVFIKIYNNLNKYNPEYKFSAWVAKITSNTCVDIIRKKSVISVSLDDAVEVKEVCKDSMPEEKYIANETKKLIDREIDKLPDKYKVPLLMFHRAGLKYDEIAQALDVPLTIVKNRIFRARKTLKEILEENRKEGML